MSAAVGIMGLSKGNLSNWRKGRLPKGDVLRRIAHFFDVPVDTLVPRTHNEAEREEELVRLFVALTPAQQDGILAKMRSMTE